MRNPDRQTIFRFREFEISNSRSAMKVGTDGVLLGAWAFASEAEGERSGYPYRIMDVGSGTGVIALMMAQRFANARITGVEIDSEAAAECAENFINSPWPERLKVECRDFTMIQSAEAAGAESSPESTLPPKADMIVSNPPFFTNGALSPDKCRNMARHEEMLPLEQLLSTGSTLLTDGGKLALILPFGHLDRLKFCAVLAGLALTRVCTLYTTQRKPPRRIMCELTKRAPSASAPRNVTQEDTLVIHMPDGCYSDEYKRLVTPFYTKL